MHNFLPLSLLSYASSVHRICVSYQAAALEQMSDLLTGVNWTTGLNVWSRFAQFDGPLTADDVGQNKPRTQL